MQFWDVATAGTSLGDWNLDGAVSRTRGFGSLGSTEDGRYFAGVYYPGLGYYRDPWARISDWVNKTAFGAAQEDRNRVVLCNLDERRIVARLPGSSFAFAPCGKWLAMVDNEGVIRIWAIPLRLPWARILGWTVFAATVCTALLVFLANLFQKVWGSRPVRWLRTGRRRQLTIPIAACLILVLIGLAWDDWATGQARDEVTALNMELQHKYHFTEADVTAFIGRPPNPGPVTIPTPANSWSGDRNYSVVRRWSRYGAVLDVYFRPDVTLQGLGSSCPRTLTEQFADWLERRSLIRPPHAR